MKLRPPAFAPHSCVLALLAATAIGCGSTDDPGMDADDDAGSTGGADDMDPPDATTAAPSDDDAGSTGGAEPGDGSDDADSTGPTVDDTPPTILSMSPADGEAGVLADTDVVITFSEPMDKAATQLAFQSADLGDVTMTWNDAGDELTVTPVEYLEWSFVESPADPAIPYAYMITTVARDAAGNELEQDAEATFTTMRGQNVMLELDLEMSGSVSAGGDNAFDASFLPLFFAGDTVADDTWGGMLTYTFDALPAETVGLAGAMFFGTQSGPNGNPYGDVGDLTLQMVSFDEFSPAIELAPTEHDFGVISTSMVPALVQVDLYEPVATRFDEGAARVQLRLRCDGPADGNGDDDTLWILAEDAQLWVTAAYP